MRNIQQSGNMYGKWITLTQISKAAARKLYASGVEVYLQSSNMMPFNVWQQACLITPDKAQVASEQEHYDWCVIGGYPLPCHTPDLAGQFDSQVNSFGYYNHDNERGRYTTYFKKIED